jgi:hypothetical protein
MDPGMDLVEEIRAISTRMDMNQAVVCWEISKWSIFTMMISTFSVSKRDVFSSFQLSNTQVSCIDDDEIFREFCQSLEFDPYQNQADHQPKK